jgi:hypothetical protein
MQKGQPAARFSADKNGTQNQTYGQNIPSDYSQGFSAGFEAGQRASLTEGTQQKNNGQRLSAGTSRQQPESNRAFIGTRQTRIEPFENPTNKNTQQHLERRPGQEQTHSYGAPVTSGNGGLLSDGFQARRSLDEASKRNLNQPTMTRDARTQNREHEINGQITNPGAEVRFNSQGHY